MKLAAVFLLAAICHADAFKLSNKQHVLSYGGFSLQRIRSRVDGSWGLQLTRPHDTAAEFRIGGDSGLPRVRNHVYLGIRSLSGGQSRQLIGMIWTGGAHCCSYYWIIDVSSTARVIFDSRQYDRYELQPVESVADLDGDGVSELVFRHALGGWHAAAFAFWPSPVQILKFDPMTYSYQPANHRFPVHSTSALPAFRQSLRAWQTNGSTGEKEQHEGRVLEAALTLAYAGRAADAKALIGRYGRSSWSEFLRHLHTDPFYQAFSAQKGFPGVH